jgi:hypothetical protein
MRTTQKTRLLHAARSQHNQHAKNAFHACEPRMRLKNFIAPKLYKAKCGAHLTPPSLLGDEV